MAAVSYFSRALKRRELECDCKSCTEVFARLGLEACKNPDVLYLVIEKLQFSSKMMLKLGGKYLNGTFFVEKQSSGKLKIPVEHTKMNTLKY